MKNRVMSLRKGVCDLLVRDARQYQLDIDTALGCKAKSRLELSVKYEIRRHYVNIIRCAVQYVHIYRFSRFILVERTVAVRHDISFCVIDLTGRQRQPLLIIRRCIRSHVPHLQEHESEAPCRRPLHHHSCVLPVAESFPAVDVFIRKIDSAVERYLAVYHEDLAVVAVIIVRRNDRYYR